MVVERLLLVVLRELREAVLLAGVVELLTKVGRARRGLVARGLEHG